MLIIKTSVNETDGRHVWGCPCCNYADVYFSCEPLECPNCKTTLPSFSLVKAEEIVRIMFYRAKTDVIL